MIVQPFNVNTLGGGLRFYSPAALSIKERRRARARWLALIGATLTSAASSEPARGGAVKLCEPTNPGEVASFGPSLPLFARNAGRWVGGLVLYEIEVIPNQTRGLMEIEAKPAPGFVDNETTSEVLRYVLRNNLTMVGGRMVDVSAYHFPTDANKSWAGPLAAGKLDRLQSETIEYDDTQGGRPVRRIARRRAAAVVNARS